MLGCRWEVQQLAKDEDSTRKAQRDQEARDRQKRLDIEAAEKAEAERRRVLDEVRRKNWERRNNK